jgi:hypothetical protein
MKSRKEVPCVVGIPATETSPLFLHLHSPPASSGLRQKALVAKLSLPALCKQNAWPTGRGNVTAQGRRGGLLSVT